MKSKVFNTVVDLLIVACLAITGALGVSFAIRRAFRLIDAHHSPTIQDPYERQSEAK